ncbi:MAG: phage holin family protein [Verrucomicrobia bacterium]|nr:phage holin family protein [Verrucomicrobiota bacterium]
MTSSGIEYTDNKTLFVVVVLFSLFNMFLKPLLILFALPFVIMTLGLGLWVINALLLYMTGALVDGFTVASFWSALWGALLISLVSGVTTALLSPNKRVVISGNINVNGARRGRRSNAPKTADKDPNVIDV